MNKNKYYGFDEDVEIYCMSVYADACDKKKVAEEASRREEAHDEAVDLIMDKIINFFRYFEGLGVMEYVDEAAAAKQIIHSLTKVGYVPPTLILDAAYKLETNIHLRLDTKLESIKRKHIVNKLTQYLENSLIKNPELEFPLPDMPTFIPTFAEATDSD